MEFSSNLHRKSVIAQAVFLYNVIVCIFVFFFKYLGCLFLCFCSCIDVRLRLTRLMNITYLIYP